MLAIADPIQASCPILNQLPGQAVGEPGACELRAVALSWASPEVTDGR